MCFRASWILLLKGKPGIGMAQAASLPAVLMRAKKRVHYLYKDVQLMYKIELQQQSVMRCSYFKLMSQE